MDLETRACSATKLEEPKAEETTFQKSTSSQLKSEEPDTTSSNSAAPEPTPKAEPYIKEDPDAPQFVSENSLNRRPRVKPEPQEPATVTIDLSLPEAGDDMFEDVDAEEVVDLTYEGIAHVDGVRYFVCEGFKIRQVPEPFIVKRSLFDLYQCIGAKSIILDPEYQREVVWDDARSALLITSILMGYFIPPIIFNVKKTTVKVQNKDEIKYTRICVDGKQRLTSIWKFIKGQIGFYDNSSPQRKWYYCHQIIDGRLQISNRNVLPSAVREFFKKQFFCCYEYAELDVDTEETMFQLVQRGITLTPAEKMRALSTPWAMCTKQFEEDYALVVNLSKQCRASGFRLVLTIFTMIVEVASGRLKKVPNRNMTAPVLQASPQALGKLLDDKNPADPELKAKFKVIFDKYEVLVKKSSSKISTTRYKIKPETAFDPAPAYLRDVNANWGRTFSPLELIATAILIQKHMEHRRDEDLLEDIKVMRTHIRNQHTDLRVNTQCWNTSWQFITDEMDKRRNIVREPGDESHAPRAPVRRRKRAVVEDDEDDDGDSSDLSSLSSSDESEGINFPALMSSRPKTRAKPAATRANAKSKSNGSKAASKGKTKVSPKRSRLSNGKSASSSKRVRRS